MTHLRRPKRLRDLLQPLRSKRILDLSAAIHRMEFGADGTKVLFRTVETQIENEDGTFSAFTTTWKDVLFLREGPSGRPDQCLVVSYPEQMEVEEWSRMFRAWARQEERKRQRESEFMDDM